MNTKTFDRIVPWFARTALVVGGVLLLSGGARAGECPADKVARNAMAPVSTQASGVTDTVIGNIDLVQKTAAFKDEHFRMRRLVVQPGGVVPWHSHEERPAIIYVVSGAITEYRSTCAVPIEHKAGEVTVEFGADLAHWWQNTTSEPAVLLSADILHDKAADKKSM